MTGPRAGARARRIDGLWDVAVAAAVVSLVYVPLMPHLAGRIFAEDSFFHWDHFVLAPALAYQHGMILLTDVYAQYGAGWAVVLGGLSGLVPLSHQNAIHAGIVYACSYFVGLYLLLRLAVGSRLVATAGTALGLYLGLFLPGFLSYTLWQWPSLTLLRSPLDVWFFVCLLCHARSGRSAWWISAGALVGLAIFLETDTGLLLAGTLFAYGCGLAASSLGERAERPLATLGYSTGALLLTLGAGLALATQGTVFSRPDEFLAGWIGGMAHSSALGVGAVYFNTFLQQEPWKLALVLASLGTCLLAVGAALLQVLHERLSPLGLVVGLVGLYGAGRFTLFAWESRAARLVVVAIPIAIIVTVALARACELAAARFALGGSRTPVLVMLGLVALLITSPALARYPNVWTMLRDGPPAAGLYLIPDRREVSGLRPEHRATIVALRSSIDRVAELGRSGERVDIVDPQKTLIYLEAGAAPWKGDAAADYNTWTRSQADELIAEFEASLAANVMIRRAGPWHEGVRDIWQAYRAVLERRCEKAESLPTYDLWRCAGRPG